MRRVYPRTWMLLMFIVHATMAGDFPSCNDPESGPCNQPGPPGCNDPKCCGQVCTVDPFCCVAEWDLLCVEIQSCQCFDWPYTCSIEDDGPPNDCYIEPKTIMDGDELEFSTLFTDTDGPSTTFCNSLPGDLQIWNDVWYIFSAENEGRLTLSCCNTVGFTAKLGLYPAGNIGDPIEPGFLPPNCVTYNPLVCRDDCLDGSENGAEIEADLAAGTQWLVRLGSSNQQTGVGKLRAFFDPVEVPCPGDFNQDGVVSGQDIGLFLVEWGECPGCQADFDQSGYVDGKDFGLMLTYWGPCG